MRQLYTGFSSSLIQILRTLGPDAQSGVQLGPLLLDLLVKVPEDKDDVV